MSNIYEIHPERNEEPALLPGSGLDPAEVRRHFSKVGAAYLAMTAAYLAVAYIIQFVILFIHPSVTEAWWWSWAVSLIPLYAVGLPMLCLCLRKVPVFPHNTDCAVKGGPSVKAPFGVKQWLILLVIAFACMTAGGLAGNFIMAVLSAVMQYDYAFALNSMVLDTPTWFTFVCTCICAPLGEELLFRKLLIDRTRRYGDLTAILLSGLLFGLFHGNLFQFFYAALVGMVLGYVYTRTGRYLPCVAMHAVINFVGSIVTPALTKGMMAYMELDLTNEEVLAELITDGGFLLALLGYLVALLWQYGVLTAGTCLFCVFFRKRQFSGGPDPKIDGSGRTATLANPGMIACIAVMFLLMAVNLIPMR